VRLICLGAVGQLATLITAALTWGSIRAAAVHHYPQYARQVTQDVNHDLTADMVILPILVAIWLVVAWGNGRGNQLARLAAVVLAVLYTLALGLELLQGVASLAPAATVISGVTWATGVVAIVFLLRAQSWPYYEHEPTARRQEVPL
jgi:hypothetical protein